MLPKVTALLAGVSVRYTRGLFPGPGQHGLHFPGL